MVGEMRYCILIIVQAAMRYKIEVQARVSDTPDLEDQNKQRASKRGRGRRRIIWC